MPNLTRHRGSRIANGSREGEADFPQLIVVQVENSAALTRIAADASLWFELDAVGREEGGGGAKPDPAQTMAGLRSQLTRRQFDIALGAIAGLTNKGIARRLGLSPFTVRNHLSRIMLVLGLKSRRDLQNWLSGQSNGSA